MHATFVFKYCIQTQKRPGHMEKVERIYLRIFLEKIFLVQEIERKIILTCPSRLKERENKSMCYAILFLLTLANRFLVYDIHFFFLFNDINFEMGCNHISFDQIYSKHRYIFSFNVKHGHVDIICSHNKYQIKKPSKIQNNMSSPAETTTLRFESSKIKH